MSTYDKSYMAMLTGTVINCCTTTTIGAVVGGGLTLIGIFGMLYEMWSE